MMKKIGNVALYTSNITHCTVYFTVANSIRRFNRKFLQGVVNIK